jgi:hypothetical protein
MALLAHVAVIQSQDARSKSTAMIKHSTTYQTSGCNRVLWEYLQRAH